MGCFDIIRVFYIGNADDNNYLVIEKDIAIFSAYFMAYMKRLHNNDKCNYYTFGSVEISESQYLRMKSEAEALVAKINSTDEKKENPNQLKLV